MKAFKNRLEEMAEATVNALDYSQAEKETLEEYYKVFDSLNKKEEYIKRSDYIPVTYLIQKFIADEEYHISLLKKALKEYEDSGDEPKKCKSVTVII
nr:MAG: Manganese containing catalase [Bacteriophage sp.]